MALQDQRIRTLLVGTHTNISKTIAKKKRMRIEDQSNWLMYRNPSIRRYETRDEYVNRVLLNQVHNHRVIIRYLVIIIGGLTTLLLK